MMATKQDLEEELLKVQNKRGETDAELANQQRAIQVEIDRMEAQERWAEKVRVMPEAERDELQKLLDAPPPPKAVSDETEETVIGIGPEDVEEVKHDDE